MLFNRLLESLFVEQMDQNEEIFARYMNDPVFQEFVAQLLGTEVYRRLAESEEAAATYTQRQNN